MTANLGNTDRLLRLIVGLVLLVAPLVNIPQIWGNTTFAYASIAVGAILVATALIQFCPLYRLLGISTCKI